MKTKILKLLLMLLCLISTRNAVADVVAGGLVYSLEGTKATIVNYTNSLPSDLIIPETIRYNGASYTVSCIGSRKYSDSGWGKTGAFYGCTWLKSIVIPASVSSITGEYESDPDNSPDLDGQVFYGCKNLETVHFLGYTDIGANAFYGCSSLKKLIFDTGVKIGKCAFWKCTSLTYLVIRGGTSLYTDSFRECNLIQNVIYLVETNFRLDLNNVNYYTPKSFVTWEESRYNYSGISPSLPSFNNNLPNGFVPTNYSYEELPKNAGTHTYYVPFTFANNDMAFDVSIPYNYTINPITLTAKVNDASRFYGDPDPEFTSTYTGFVNNEDASVILSHGNYEPTASIKSDIGVYAIKQSGAKAQNYIFNYEDGILTVNKAPLTMTANDKSMIYGSSVPKLDAKYEGLKNNEAEPSWNSVPEFSTTGNETSKVGNYPISITNADAKNYQLTIQEGVLTIEKADLTVTADNKNRLYGDIDPEFTLSFTGLKNNEEAPEWEKVPTIESTANVQSPVGNYPISIKDAVAVNYNINAIDGTLTINKAPLQVTPNNATRKYGEENPQFTLSYEGLKNNENVPEWTEEPIISTQATKESSVGEYSIQITSAEALNYTLEKKVGTLTITKAPLSVGVNNYSRVYGEANPNFDMYYTGLVNEETTPQWIEMPIISTEATETSDVGEYAITAIGGVMKNYETNEIVPGTLSVTQAALTIKANDVTRLYFEENPELSYTCTGFIGNDDEQSFDVKPQIKTNATKDSNVGVYVIEIGNAESKNYSLNYEKGLLTINKRQLNVSTKDYTRFYGEENPEFEINYTGFVNNENEAVLISKPKASTEADSKTDVGIYDITIGGGVAENYDFSYTGGKLTIEQAYQTLSWEQDLSDLKQYDQIELTAVASSELPVTYTIEGDQICSIVKIGTKQYLDCFGEGETVIVAIQEGNNNYYQSTKIYKTIKITSPSGINMTNIYENEDIKIFDANGNQRNKIQRGVNIIKMSNGTTKKIVVK